MNRRLFIEGLGALAAGMVLDPEKLLWVRGAKMISIPAAASLPAIPPDPWAGFFEIERCEMVAARRVTVEGVPCYEWCWEFQETLTRPRSGFTRVIAEDALVREEARARYLKSQYLANSAISGVALAC